MGLYLNASFITSSIDFRQCPAPLYPEYAFIGRSNVGKSSLINMITGQKMLAKISSTPGKTRLINHFLVNGQWYLVDLPGYGYARVGRGKRNMWAQVIEEYLLKRTNLMSTFILVDSRLPMQENDRNVINWFGQQQIHFSIVFTKTDKVSDNQLAVNLKEYKTALYKYWEELPVIIASSARTGMGQEEIVRFIEAVNKMFRP